MTPDSLSVENGGNLSDLKINWFEGWNKTNIDCHFWAARQTTAPKSCHSNLQCIILGCGFQQMCKSMVTAGMLNAHKAPLCQESWIPERSQITTRPEKHNKKWWKYSESQAAAEERRVLPIYTSPVYVFSLYQLKTSPFPLLNLSLYLWSHKLSLVDFPLLPSQKLEACFISHFI